MLQWGHACLAGTLLLGACVNKPSAPAPPDGTATAMAPSSVPTSRWLRAFPPLRDAEAEAEAPALLTQTGLYRDLGRRELSPGVRLFRPQFELWSDGAEKQRYVLLPPGTRIDTSDMDRWQFPVGVKLWKEFRKDGKLLETRLLWKVAVGWRMATYLWDASEADAQRNDEGPLAIRGTDHDVPRQAQCIKCHRDEVEAPLGFAAIQLSGAGAGVRLRQLMEEGLLTKNPREPDGYGVPGDAGARAALGYLHGNCGGCHAPDTQLFMTVTMSLRLEVGKLATVAAAPAYVTTANQPTTTARVESMGRIRMVPGNATASEIHRRMGIRERFNSDSIQMPPIGSHVVDAAARSVVGAWIGSL